MAQISIARRPSWTFFSLSARARTFMLGVYGILTLSLCLGLVALGTTPLLSLVSTRDQAVQSYIHSEYFQMHNLNPWLLMHRYHVRSIRPVGTETFVATVDVAIPTGTKMNTTYLQKTGTLVFKHHAPAGWEIAEDNLRMDQLSFDGKTVSSSIRLAPASNQSLLIATAEQRFGDVMFSLFAPASACLTLVMLLLFFALNGEAFVTTPLGVAFSVVQAFHVSSIFAAISAPFY